MVVTGLEVIPISTFLTIVANQVLEVAVAAKDVLIEKESFQKLSRYLSDIEPVLRELKDRCFKDLTAARQALDSLKSDLGKAHELIQECQDKCKFYLLVNCRTIVKDAQEVTRDIGKDLELLSLAGTELSLDVRDNLLKLQNQFQSAEFQASQARSEILDRLEVGIREHRTDQGFANDMIVAIATAVGIPVESSHINQELSSFKKEKESLALLKKKQEEAFIGQVLQLLSTADAACTSDSARQNYAATLEALSPAYEEPMAPLKSFFCPLTLDDQSVMVDPVTASSDRTYERKNIECWFACGNTTDPVTHTELSDFTLRPNTLLKQSIQEWKDRNYCCRMWKAKRYLEETDEAVKEEALDELCSLCKEAEQIKDWVGGEQGLIASIVKTLGIHNKQLQAKSLMTLQILVDDNLRNLDQVLEAGALSLVVRCLGKGSLCRLATRLLLQLVIGDASISYKLCQEKSAILYLVMQQNDDEAAKIIVERLCEKDESIVQMASLNFLQPLVSRILEGGEDSRVAMAKALGSIESLSDENQVMLGENIIPTLVAMVATGKLEAKVAALEAMKSLSSNTSNQQNIARAGGFSVLMNHLISTRSPQVSRECAAKVLNDITMSCKQLSLADEHGTAAVSLDEAVEALLGLLSSPYSVTTRAHIVQVLLGMAMSADGARVREVVEARGIPFLVNSLDGNEKELRESCARLLCCLSEYRGAAVAEYFINSKNLNLLLNLLHGSGSSDIRAASATILANLPNSKGTLASLQEAGAVPALISVIEDGDNAALTEKALAALERFTDPLQTELQRQLAESNIHSLLVRVLKSGTPQTKALAALQLKNLSSNTPELSTAPAVSGGWLCFRPTAPSSCKVHRGVCSARSTFCIVEAKAVPSLIKLLEVPSSVEAEAALQALSTLIANSEIAERGSLYLHEVSAIEKVIDVLVHGTQSSKSEAVTFLGYIFRYKKMRDLYGLKAKIPLVESASTGPIKRKSAKVLGQLGFIQEISTSYF